MQEFDKSVLETEIAKLLNRSSANIPLKLTTVKIRALGQGRLCCRIEVFGKGEHSSVKAGFEDILGDGFFVRAERSLMLQLEEPSFIPDNMIAAP